MADYQQEGAIIPFTNGTGAALAVDTPVKIGGTSTSATLGVVKGAAVAISGTGQAAIEGVHVLPKVSGAVIAAGERVLWDASAAAVDDDAATPATGDFFCGTAFEAAGAGVTSIAVKLNGTATDAT